MPPSVFHEGRYQITTFQLDESDASSLKAPAYDNATALCLSLPKRDHVETVIDAICPSATSSTHRRAPTIDPVVLRRTEEHSTSRRESVPGIADSTKSPKQTSSAPDYSHSHGLRSEAVRADGCIRDTRACFAIPNERKASSQADVLKQSYGRSFLVFNKGWATIQTTVTLGRKQDATLSRKRDVGVKAQALRGCRGENRASSL